MLGNTRYYAAQLGESQRYLPPVIAYVALLATLYTEPTEALHVEYAVSVGAMVVCSCWLTIALVSVEDPVQRKITLSHARRWFPIVGAIVLTVLMSCCGLTALSLVWSLIIHRAPTTPGVHDDASGPQICSAPSVISPPR